MFCCVKCKNALDSDLNASLNLSFVLPEINKEARQNHLNIQGFYWNANVFGSEYIVPNVQKAY